MKTIIGIGHKARQGKDYLAKLMTEIDKDIQVIHWADALYEEVRNSERKLPLIEIWNANSTNFEYLIHDDFNNFYFESNEVPLLDKIFTDRNITEYEGMDEKDSLMLQFWGTDFRRKFFGQDYWVKKGLEKIESIKDGIILIPDTRFKNEAEAIKELGGIYIDVQRFNEDGTRYVASDRDPNHSSEIDLDDYKADIIVTAKSGELDKLEKYANEILSSINCQTC